ncbi:hypothetical protein GCM10009557_55090 [Virgisporangium ochraceum]|uniref:Uncharacterized protein n=1 Tax=Virgisporangium ochraceum TaxID=65505 RepID=A0A8J3ZJI7_9ACTN|nr:hypothetical protein Voc01_003210 [Virgisporangium ochraceum]
MSGAPTGDDGTAVVEAVRNNVNRLVGGDPEFMQGRVDAFGTLVGIRPGTGRRCRRCGRRVGAGSERHLDADRQDQLDQ